jgi:O-antigen ligase
VTVQAPSAVQSAILLNEPFSGSSNAALCILAMLLVGIARASGNKRSVRGNVRLVQTILATAVFAALLVSAGCAGLASSQNPAQPAPYVVTVTASAANAPTHTQQFTFYVKP